MRDRQGLRLLQADSAAMPSRFYFHLVKGKERIIDRVGLTLPRDVVVSPAVMAKVKERWPGTADVHEWEGWIVEIADANGRVVRTLPIH